jgi:predicted amidophosphoribosyltransferase
MIYNHPEDNQSDISYLGSYHKYRIGSERNPAFDSHSSLILNLKNEYEQAITAFYNRIDPLLKDGIAICYVPSHDPEKSTSGIRTLASRLAANRRFDATSCIVRHTKINKLSSGGNRNITVHLNSLKVENPHLIMGKHVLLLDDVTTTNNSLNACRGLLLQAGASNVKCLALGQTVLE